MNVAILPTSLPMPSFVSEADGAWLVHTLSDERRGRTVIQLVAAGRGHGVSSLCRDLGLIASRRPGRRVLLLDIQPAGPGQVECARALRSIVEVEPIADLRGKLALFRWGSLSLHVGQARRADGEWAGVMPLLREGFDLVIVDSPSIDRSYAGVMLSPLVDATVLVARAGSTRAGDIRHLRDRIFDAGGVIAGSVLNRSGSIRAR